jgi:Ser/Thr protein kinase RdoA (MazF antagonist)
MSEFRRLEHSEQLRRLDEVAEQALRQFGLRPESCELLQHEDNAVYRVTHRGGTQYVLRIGAEDGCSALEQASELEWLGWLRAQGQPVPDPVPAPSGDCVVEVCTPGVSVRACVLFRWLEGEPPASTISEAELGRLGETTAQLHSCSSAFCPAPSFTRPTLGLNEVLEDLLAQPPTAQHELLTRLRERLAIELVGASEAACLIHGDLHRDNILVQAGKISFIDFDDCGWGHPLLDVASLLDSFRRRVIPPGDYARARAAFLEGYGSRASDVPELMRRLCGFKALRDAITLRFITRSRNENVLGWAPDRVAQLVAHIHGYLEGDRPLI